MRYLLDTQSWLWIQVAPERLNHDTIVLLEDPSAEFLLSAASSWEISIKYALGKLPLPAAPKDYVPDRMRSSGVIGLPVTHTHALHVASLPDHHRDPFDRILVSQAQLDVLTVVTADRAFERYDVPVHWSS